ncbi:DUF1287 domain-containing protein [uncultured Clostridium sp.]|uniref:DUF1287 domain-containing protein n=1 Tax=uncultured Clostridium sp. TaxID=59620 RepID=UPI0028E536E0|nr:DUF1287 domain-containing protein [uncultured Clostridium sp.]
MKRSKKKVFILILMFLLTIGFLLLKSVDYDVQELIIKIEQMAGKRVIVPEEYSKVDRNNNGIPDSLDIVKGAREEVKNKTKYVDAYYNGGYPPDSEGVCTDVIWRAFKSIDLNLKELIDEDIKKNTKIYWRVQGTPEPNIDFRRVPNQDVFFKNNAESLINEIIPGDVENLKQWQPGDIIIMYKPYEHVVIVSDKRDRNGVPYIIHNYYPYARETLYNYKKLKVDGHYRWKY